MGGDPCRMQSLLNPRRPSAHQTRVDPLRFFVDAFVNTFGITQPAPESAAKAGRYIAIMLAAVLIFLAAVAWLLRGLLTR
jgi:hypothetical protein